MNEERVLDTRMGVHGHPREHQTLESIHLYTEAVCGSEACLVTVFSQVKTMYDLRLKHSYRLLT